MRGFDDSQRFGPVTKAFHWLTFVLVVALFAIGLYMVELELSPEMLEIYALHKSIGVTVLVLSAARLVWRAVNPTPPLLGTPKPWERAAARATHGALYLLLLGMPMSGWLMSGAADFPVVWFGLVELPSPLGPDEELKESLLTMHRLLGLLLGGLLVVHIAAAFKHHLIDRDATLKRMLPSRPDTA